MPWHARLQLDYSLEAGRSVARFRHDGPLRILQSLYPEGDATCHNVLVHPPGGLVGGDTLAIDITVGPGAHGLITTPNADIVFVESGGDNLAATFSPELSDLTIYVIDVAAGEKIPRKGGPGITKSDLFVINKTDLAPYVGADLGVMQADTTRMRTTANGLKPFVMTNLKTRAGLSEVISFIETKGMLHAG